MSKSLFHLVLLSVLLTVNLHGKTYADTAPQVRWMDERRIYGVIQIGGILRLELGIEPALPHAICEELKHAGSNNRHSFELALALQSKWCKLA